MSDVIGSAEIEIRATKKKLKQDADAAKREIQQATKEIERAYGDAGKGAAREFKVAHRQMEADARRAVDAMGAEFHKLGLGIGRTLAGASRVAQVALAGIIAYSVKAAADAAELEDAFRIAFGAGAKGAEDYAKALSDKAGRSQLEIMESMTKFRLLLKDQDAATAESITQALQARAIDVGSLFNIKDADVVQKFFSGLSGEAEPLKALGVNLNEAAMKAELLRLGFKGSASEASEQAKQVARANIILRETQVAAGNAAATIGSTANQFKKLQGETRDSAAAFGKQFLPIANQVLKWATDALTAFNNLPSGVQSAGLALLALAAASGPITSTIIGLQNLIKTAIAARAALMAIPAGGAGGAAASGALGAGAAATGALGGMLTFGYASGRDDINGVIAERLTRDNSMKTQMQQLAASDKEIDQALQWFSEWGRARGENLAKIATLKAIKAEREQFAARKAMFDAEKSTGLPSLTPVPGGGFSLTPDMLKPVGGDGKKKADSAAEKARKQAEAEMARAEERFWKDLAAGKSESYELWLDNFKKSILELDGTPSGFVAAGDNGLSDALASMAEQDAATREAAKEEFRYMFSDGLMAALSGDKDAVARWWQDVTTRGLQNALDSLADVIFELFSNAASSSGAGSGGGGDFWATAAKIATSVFGGGKAGGGDVMAGRKYLVGERGPEILEAPFNGMITPNVRGASAPNGAAPRAVEHRVIVVPDEASFIKLSTDSATPLVAGAASAVYGQVQTDRRVEAKKAQYAVSRRGRRF